MAKAVIINDTRVDLHHGCDRVWRALKLNCASVGIDIIASSPAHKDWRDNEPFMRAFESADLVIVNGEGTIHHNQPAGVLLLRAGRVARQKGIPAALINCSWEGNGPELKEKLADFSLVSVRESLSEREIRSENIRPLLVPDLSLDGLEWQSGSRRMVGFGDSVVRSDLPMLYSLLKRTPGGVSCPVQYPSSGINGVWHYFRSYIGHTDFGHPQFLARMIASRYRQWQVCTRDSEEFVRRISSLRLLVSGRFHSTCVAMGTGTPFLALGSNSHKVKGMLKDAGIASRLVILSEINEKSILFSMTWSRSERESLSDYLVGASCRRVELFKRLSELVN